jgi:hypothetical protein
MVHREDRDVACKLIEQLANGEITNEDFDEAFPRRSKDRALFPVYAQVWFQYSRHTHKLVSKHGLNPEAKQLLKRCVAFLRSDLEYEWPDYKWIDPKRILLGLLGQRRKVERDFERFKAAGDFEVWPFFRVSDRENSSGSRAS